ncbi:MAG: RNA-binding protein [Pedobacter sp.]|nr:MAG: RNA-binding protein [Pedobacter sp.]
MIQIGEYNTLRIAGKNKDGLSLSDGKSEILLPYDNFKEALEIGNNVEVFVYINKTDDLVATTKKAYGQCGDYVLLQCIDEHTDGAYLDLGIEKDVFVPKKEQKRPMIKGESYVVYLYLDELNRKLVASSKVDKFAIEQAEDLEEGDEVQVLICDKSDLGYNAIIDQKYMGLLYHNEIFGLLMPGDERRAWVKKIRVDGHIDLTLQASGYGHVLDTKDVILEALAQNKGVIALGDKSNPDDIYAAFEISKSVFKKAIGALYKERKIVVGDYEISLVEQSGD